MKSRFGLLLEDFLLSDSFWSVLILPMVAVSLLLVAIWGSGLLGAPAPVGAKLPRSLTDNPPIALIRADSNEFENWASPGAPSPKMSQSIVNVINSGMSGVSDDNEFFGQSFPSALLLPDSLYSKTDDVASGSEGPAEPSSDDTVSSRMALEKWQNSYWCERRGFDGAWLDEVVRPLIVRGVGDCSFWQRFSARSPLISGSNAMGGVVAFFALCALAAFFAFLSVEQVFLRRAYRLQYHSGLFA